MELRQLRYFAAVAEHLSFSKAARTVHVTQSTISHQIKQLEHELGYDLFKRDRQSVKMTKQGEALLPDIVRILKELDETIQLSKKGHPLLRENLRLLVGVYSIANGVLPGALRRFNARCPDVSVSVEMIFANELQRRFGEEGYSLAVGIEDATARFAFSPLCREELALMVHPDHPLAGRRSVRLIELHGERLTLPSFSYSHRKQIDHCFESAGSKPLIVAEFDNPNTMIAVLSEQTLGGIAPYSVPEWLQGKRLVRVHLDPTLVRNVVLYWPDQPSQAVQVLAESLMESAHDVTRQANSLGLLPVDRRQTYPGRMGRMLSA